jgi:hypothetical protein
MCAHFKYLARCMQINFIFLNEWKESVYAYEMN